MVTVRRLPVMTEDGASGRKLHFLEPRGLGSAELEAATSLFCRVAERHWVLTVAFWNSFLSPEVRTHRRKEGGNGKRLVLQAMNGYGKCAETVSALLQNQTGGADVRYLTLLPWKSELDPMAHDLLKTNLAWCPRCWLEDREDGAPLYVRLMWLLKTVTVCQKHHLQLHSACPNCGSNQEIIPRIPRQWVCRRCGADLAARSKKARIRSVDPKSKEMWIAKAVGALIARTCATGSDLPVGSWRRALLELVNRHFGGSYDAFADALVIDRRMIKQWGNGKTKPYLSGVLEVAYRIQVPPDVLLFDGVGLLDPCDWQKAGRPCFVKRDRKLSADNLENIHKALQKEINSKRTIPLSGWRIAKNLGTTFMVVKYHFPKEFAILSARARKCRALKNMATRLERVKRAVKAAESLASKGIYPSERALKKRRLVSPTDLKRRDVSRALRPVRLNYLSANHQAFRRKRVA